MLIDVLFIMLGAVSSIVIFYAVWTGLSTLLQPKPDELAPENFQYTLDEMKETERQFREFRAKMRSDQ
ncbi:MAG: hypothetical protein WC455_19115 [Dehalococcoidia bacterium]|jgi:hypothetical protein